MMAGDRLAAPGLTSGMRLDNGHVLGAVAVVAPAVGVFAPLALAPLLAVAAVAAVAVARLRGDSWSAFPGACAVLLGVTVLWSLISLLWAPEPRFAAAKLGELALLFAAGVVVLGVAMSLDRAQRRRVERLLIIGFALALALLCIELVAGYPIRYLERTDWPGVQHLKSSFDRGATVLAVLVWPAARALWRRSNLAAVGLWIATAALVTSLSSATAKLALLLGIAVFVAGRATPRATAAILGGVLAVAIVVSPLLAARIPSLDILDLNWPFNTTAGTTGKSAIMSGKHRLLIWRFTADRIAEKPLFGWGFNASRWLPGGNAIVMDQENALPLHPHNVALQWWVELGLPGALLAATLALLAAGAIRRIDDPHGAASGAALLTSAATIAALSFGTWQSWWIAALALAAAFHTATVRCETTPAA